MREPAQHRLAVEQQPLGRGERHHHEAVGAGERRLEDADDVEVVARAPWMRRADVGVESLRHLAADHHLVAPGLRASRRPARTRGGGRAAVAREQLHVDAERQRRQREGQRRGLVGRAET